MCVVGEHVFHCSGGVLQSRLLDFEVVVGFYRLVRFLMGLLSDTRSWLRLVG